MAFPPKTSKSSKMTQRIMTVGYQNRNSRGYGGSGIGSLSRDLPTAPKIVLANHIIQKICGFSIGEKVNIEYLQGSIIISKLTKIT